MCAACEIRLLDRIACDPFQGAGGSGEREMGKERTERTTAKRENNDSHKQPLGCYDPSQTPMVAAGADGRVLSVLTLINPTILKSKHSAVLPTIRFLLLSNKVSALFISNNMPLLIS